LDTFSISSRRYIGGKSQLVDNIFKAIPYKYAGGTFMDVFAGTGVVADAALKQYETVILNDLLYSNNIIYQAFFGHGKYSWSKLEAFAKEANSKVVSKLPSNYFDKHFGGKYFSKQASKMIGHIRCEIERYNLTKRERFILLASLIYSADRIANTVGHYEAFRKSEKQFKPFQFRLIKPYKEASAVIYRQDANELVKSLSVDVAYIDPPYNSRQYSRFYHVLENLAKWEKPKLEGVALKPPLENLSEYCTVRAPEAFSNLIENLDAKLIVVSYNNTYESKSSSSKNKITLAEIKSTLRKKGKTRVKEVQHKFFNSGKTNFPDHRELIFITETH
jgi:adenine-specific DNA-methyltransferase